MDVSERCRQFGIARNLDVRFTPLLKSRWQFGLFTWRHRPELAKAQVIFTRAPEIAMRLGRAGIRHHLEVHDIAEMRRKRQLQAVIRSHDEGTLGWLIAISRAAANSLIEAGACADRIHIAPSGVCIEDYAAVPELDCSRLDKPRVLYIGRISRDRGLDVLAAAAQSGLCEVTLVGDQDDRVEGPMRRVPFVAPREVPEWYGRSDLILLPYQADLAHAASISPIKLFEAMAAGRPIIASDLPPIREIIKHGVNGLLVKAHSTEHWMQAIERLQSDRALAGRIARQAHEDARQYSWQARAAGILTRLERRSRT